jgi:hypothetical protein
MSEKLKPCPFCGGEAIWTSWGIRCSGCGVWVSDLASSGPGKSRRGADAWDVRVADPREERLVELLREWRKAPFFEKREDWEDWEDWVADFRARVDAELGRET